MQSSSIKVFAALGCVLLASCYPYDESKDQRRQSRRPIKKMVVTPEAPTLPEQTVPSNQSEVAQITPTDTTTPPAEMKTSPVETKTPPVQSKAPAAETKPSAAGSPSPSGRPKESPKPPAPEKRPEYAVANKVPGKEGFVFSPYNNKVVDVRDIPSGTLVQDPTYTGAGKGYFRVP
ncbi:MAG: hypothetical protein QE267_05780 [Akkermansiaceae bacterium]|nr:hypothetical protein [Akkermansiaceae bacterium]